MEVVTLTKDHFYNLRRRLTAYTFLGPDCPISRSLKQSYPSLDLRIGAKGVDIKDIYGQRELFKIEGGMNNIERCRLELLNGANEAKIRIFDISNEWLNLTK
jgi:hypothetical protein